MSNNRGGEKKQSAGITEKKRARRTEKIVRTRLLGYERGERGKKWKPSEGKTPTASENSNATGVAVRNTKKKLLKGEKAFGGWLP